MRSDTIRAFAAGRTSTVLWVTLGWLTLTGCATMGFKYDESALKKQVAFDTQCPQEKIEVVDAMEAGIGVTKFRMNVCGQEQKWNRMGTSYFAEGKGPTGMR